ncbi:MAG: hypothetical protein V1646_01395 [bacterium]
MLFKKLFNIKKMLYTNALAFFLINFSLIQATVIDLEIMRLGKDTIILAKDQHHVDDSQEIWQAGAILLSAMDEHKPADLILVEKNDITKYWDSLPDVFSGDKSAQIMHDTWVQNLVSFVNAKNQKSKTLCLNMLQSTLKSTMPNHSTNLSFLNLFYDAYTNIITSQQIHSSFIKPLSVDHREGSILIFSCASEYFELFRADIQQWNEQKALPNIMSISEAITKDLTNLPQIPLSNLQDEQDYIKQFINNLKGTFHNNAELAEKLDSEYADHQKEKSHILKAFVYLHDLELLNNISCDELKARLKDEFFNPNESSVIQKILPESITNLLIDGINRQTQYILGQLALPQTRLRQKEINSFLQKRFILFITLNFDSFPSTAQMVDLESIQQIVNCVNTPHDKPKKILMLCGEAHAIEIVTMLEMLGAESVEQTEIIDDVLRWTNDSEDDEEAMSDETEDAQPEKSSAEAFKLCRPINKKLATLY